MADERKRIINLTETDTITAEDYIAMDSVDGGTKKIPASHFTGRSDNVMWGGIQGDIADQTDLYNYLKQLPDKANIDGYYEDMSVGSAEQLLSNTYEPDNTPYLYRTSGGSLEIGDRVYEDAIVGGSVAWNQLVKNGNFESDTGWENGANSTLSVSNNIGTVTVISTPDNYTNIRIGRTIYEITQGHKYFMRVDAKPSSAHELSIFIINSQSPKYRFTTVANSWNRLESIGITSNNNTFYLAVGNDYSSWQQGDTIEYKNVMIFDLTLMFGSTIADYVYSLEQATAGSGIAWLKSQGFFGKDYYAYNAGGIESVKTSAKKVVGFNAYNNTTGKANLVGGHEYQITGAYTALAYSTGETITPDANGKFTPSADGELTVTGGNGTTTCVHLVLDGERDGEYEAYEEHTYPLGNDELRGLFKLSNGKIYADGDIKKSDGTITRKYKLKTFNGTENWSSASYNRYYINISDARPTVIGIYYPMFITDGKVYFSTSTSEWAGLINDQRNFVIYAPTNIASTDDFKAYLASNPLTILYELATPTTESADPYTNPQLVDNWGTEEFVDERDVPVPVGHDSRYLPDLKAKLESAPNNPSTNGKYFLQYQNGEATYVSVPSEVPQTPSEDGTYVLKATVSSGTATLSWVAEE